MFLELGTYYFGRLEASTQVTKFPQTYITCNISRGLGSLDRNCISSEIIPFLFRLFQRKFVEFLQRKAKETVFFLNRKVWIYFKRINWQHSIFFFFFKSLSRMLHWWFNVLTSNINVFENKIYYKLKYLQETTRKK